MTPDKPFQRLLVDSTVRRDRRCYCSVPRRPHRRRTGADEDRKSRDAARERLQTATTGARDVIGQCAATLRRLARGRRHAADRYTTAFHRFLHA